MLSYACIGTNDLARATRFYDAVLKPLAMERIRANDPTWDRIASGWGLYEDNGLRERALWVVVPFDKQAATAGNGTMIALQGKLWSQIDEFFEAALAHGGRSEGAPRLRPQYDADFYAAYVRDPDGNKLAAFCRGFTSPPR